jgi:hypothetical protein
MSHLKSCKKLHRLSISLLILLFIHLQGFATVWYVKPTASGSGNGTSWANASASIQTIINAASAGDQIWVAGGTYVAPYTVNGPFTYYSFVLKNGVELYGGFSGNETLINQRNYQSNETILAGNGNTVVKALGSITRATILDGFSIINGTGTNGVTDLAGGLGMTTMSSPTIQHCKFYNNSTINNTAGGGAISINQSNPLIIDCIFYNNTAIKGGAIYANYYNAAEIVNCSFYNNTASSGNGDAIFIGSAVNNSKIIKVVNSIIYGNGNNEIFEEASGYLTVNYSNIKGGYSNGIGNIDLDPKFVNAAAGNLKLAYNSPSVQTGDNGSYNSYAVLNNSLDLAGNTRLSANLNNTGSNIDMGAYQYIVTAPANLTYNSPNFLTKNISAVNLIPTVDGTPTTLFTIDQTLPAGLSFNTSNGAITGTPSQVFTPTVFSITTSNYVGTTSGTVHITVNELKPQLSYTTPVSYTVGQTFSPTLSPVNTGGEITGGLIAIPVVQNLGINAMSSSVIDNTGNLFIVKDNSGEVYKMTSSGNLSLYATGLVSPTGITIDPSGNLYVTSASSINGHKVYKIDINGQVTILNQNAESNFRYPMGIKYGGDGNVYVTELYADKIIKVNTTTGAQTVFASNISPDLSLGPVNMIKDNNGDWIVFNKDATISKVSATGVVTQNYFNSGAFAGDLSGPFDVTKDAEGNIYAAGYRNGIIKINTIGDPELFATIPGPTHTLLGINFNSLGELLVNFRNIGTNLSSIYKFSPGKLKIQPTLPTGLEFNEVTGIISGTPTAISQATNYTIAATNSGGTFTTTVNLEVKGTIIYSTPNTYTKGTVITTLIPNTNGITANSFSISPALPAGLSIDPNNGNISGTPTALIPETEFIVSANSIVVSLLGKIKITVIDIPPTNLTYVTPNVYTKGSSITSLIPTVGGGAVTNYTVNPALPTGISINAVTGIITGTPTVLASAGVYTVTASNTGGAVSFGINITVNDIAPSNLSYTSPNVYTKGTAITTLTPTLSGGTVLSFTVNPALPIGLTLDTLNGKITGTPSVLANTGVYTVTATNTGGATSFGIKITVNDIAPSGISYSTPNILYKDKAATALIPTQTSGGVVTNYSISPALPTGLTIDAITGIISGTSSVLSDPTDYTVTASNSGGSTTALLNIKVILFLFAKDSILQQNNCINDSSGKILVKAQGGYAPYLYAINGGAYQTSGIFSNLPSGVYQLSLKDSTGSVVNIIDTIKTLSNIPIQIFYSKTDNKCFADSLGKIIVDSVTGGVAPFRYFWSKGTVFNNGVNKLPKGTYDLIVQDFYGCQDSVKIDITEPTKLLTTTQVINPSCYNQCNGILNTSANGGTGRYTYQWSNGATTKAINNLCSGVYTVTVRDSVGCENASSFNLLNPLPFKVEMDSLVTICSNQIYKNDFNNINYPNSTFSWTSDNGYISNSSVLSTSKAGSYFVKATNPNGCVAADTIILKMQNNTIESVFAVATNVFKNDTIHIVNISNPRPDKSVWTYPIDSSIKLIYKNEDSLRLKFTNEGTYAIQLNTKLGACVDSSLQTVHILNLSGITRYTFAPLGLNSIQNLVISPNPNRGQFNVSLKLQNTSSIAIRIMNISNGRLVYSNRYPAATNFNIPFNLLLSADIYALIIETEFGAVSVSKILIL